MSKNNQILLLGNNAFANRGCEAIVRGTREIVTKTLAENYSLLNLSFGDSMFIKEQQSRERDPSVRSVNIERWSLPRRFWYRRINKYIGLPFKPYENYSLAGKYAQESIAALQIGGDNYSLCYGLDVLKRFCKLDEYVRKEGLPSILWAASVGPFDDEVGTEKWMAEHLKGFDYVLVRETGSQEYLASIGVTDNVRLVADPAFVMVPEEPQMDDTLRGLIEQKPVGLNLSPMITHYRKDVPGGWYNFAVSLVESVLSKTDAPVLLIPHVTLQGDNDYVFLKEVMSAMKKDQDRVYLVSGDYNAQEYKWIISKLQCLVAARTHATIAAFSSCIPTISIGYSLKAQGINRDLFGHTDWLLPVDKLSPESLEDKYVKLQKELPDVKQGLESVVDSFQERAYSCGLYLREVMGNK